MAPQRDTTHGDLCRQLLKVIGDQKRGNRTLRTYHALGAILFRASVPYGSKTVERIAHQLSKAGVEKLSAFMLHKCRKLASTFSRGNVSRLEKRGVSLRSALQLTSKHLSDTMREAILREIQSGQLKPESVSRRIVQCSSRLRSASERPIVAAQKRAEQALKQLRRIAADSAVDVDVRKRAKKALSDCRSLLSSSL